MIITRCKREEIDYKSVARNSAFRLVRRRGKVRMVFGSQRSCKNIWESWVLYENEGAHALRQFLCSKRGTFTWRWNNSVSPRPTALSSVGYEWWA